MAAADTNLLVRLLVADDRVQLARARRALRDHGSLFITQIALVETIWVLDRTYGIARAELASIIERLLQGAEFVLEGPGEITAALDAFRFSRPGFADCLLIENARTAGQLPLLTFEKALAKVEGAKLL